MWAAFVRLAKPENLEKLRLYGCLLSFRSGYRPLMLSRFSGSKQDIEGRRTVHDNSPIKIPWVDVLQEISSQPLSSNFEAEAREKPGRGMRLYQVQRVLTAPLKCIPSDLPYSRAGSKISHYTHPLRNLQGLPSDEFIDTYGALFSEAPSELAPSMYILDLQGGTGFEKPAYGPIYTGTSAASWYAISCWTDPKDTDKGERYC